MVVHVEETSERVQTIVRWETLTGSGMLTSDHTLPVDQSAFQNLHRRRGPGWEPKYN